MGAGSPLLLANQLHNVKTVTREFISLTHTVCLSWTRSSGHTFSTVCAPPHAFRSLVWAPETGRAQVQAKLSTNL